MRLFVADDLFEFVICTDNDVQITNLRTCVIRGVVTLVHVIKLETTSFVDDY